MQIQITITPDSLDDAIAVLTRLGAQPVVAQPTAAAPSPRGSRKAKAEAAPAAVTEAVTEAVPAVDPGPVEDAKVVSETTAPAIDYDRDVRPVLAKAATDPALLKSIVALLAAYGVKRGQDVPVDRLPAFADDLTALVSQPEAEPLL